MTENPQHIQLHPHSKNLKMLMFFSHFRFKLWERENEQKKNVKMKNGKKGNFWCVYKIYLISEIYVFLRFFTEEKKKYFLGNDNENVFISLQTLHFNDIFHK